MSKKLTIGIDIGGTNTVIGYVDESGNVYADASIPTNSDEGPISLFERIASKAKNIAKGIDFQYELVGVGIGAPNANYYDGTVVNAVNLGWKGRTDIVGLAKKHFNVPAAITNDANATALGEMLFGSAKGMKNFIVVTLGTGLGSGIIVNGDLLYGKDGLAGEMGHVCVEPNGRLCGCGRLGCLETYASATGLVNTAKELLAKDNSPSILRDVDNITSKLISDAANKKDALALNAFDITGKYLGQECANAIHYFNSEAIIFFGGMAQSGDLIMQPTKRYLEENLMEVFKNGVKLQLTGLPEASAAIMGASALIWNELKKA